MGAGAFWALPGNYTRNEFAGACYIPDGQWLFVNIQTPGGTFATVRGRWRLFHELHRRLLKPGDSLDAVRPDALPSKAQFVPQKWASSAVGSAHEWHS